MDRKKIYADQQKKTYEIHITDGANTTVEAITGTHNAIDRVEVLEREGYVESSWSGGNDHWGMIEMERNRIPYTPDNDDFIRDVKTKIGELQIEYQMSLNEALAWELRHNAGMRSKEASRIMSIILGKEVSPQTVGTSFSRAQIKVSEKI